MRALVAKRTHRESTNDYGELAHMANWHTAKRFMAKCHTPDYDKTNPGVKDSQMP